VCVLKVEGISCLKEVLSFLFAEWGSIAVQKDLEDVKKGGILLKNDG
jgi:hypothetical protein